MAFIRLRPVDLALLAQRLDATSEDFRRSAKRLEAELGEVALNAADGEFRVGRFNERSVVVRAQLRRLSDELGVDGSLLAAAAHGGEYSNDGEWLESLQVLLAGWGPGSSLGSACSSVIRGLSSIVDAAVAPFRSDVTGTRHDWSVSVSEQVHGEVVRYTMVDDSLAAGDGGLFLTVSASAHGDVAYLGGMFGRVARDESTDSRKTGPDDPDWSKVWARIDNDLRSG